MNRGGAILPTNTKDMRTGQCFALYDGGRRDCFFYTGITEADEEGRDVLVMCKMLRSEQITIKDFIKISEEDYFNKIKSGEIEEF